MNLSSRLAVYYVWRKRDMKVKDTLERIMQVVFWLHSLGSVQQDFVFLWLYYQSNYKSLFISLLIDENRYFGEKYPLTASLIRCSNEWSQLSKVCTRYRELLKVGKIQTTISIQMSLQMITQRVILRKNLGDALKSVKVIQLERVKGESMGDTFSG